MKTLRANVDASDAKIKTLEAEKTALQAKNTTLEAEKANYKTETATLTEENSELKAALEAAKAENASLKAIGASILAELKTARQENLQLKAMLGSGNGNVQKDIEVVQSAFLPTDLASWLKIVAVFLIAAVLLISYNTYMLFKDIRRKKAAVLLGMYNSSSMGRQPHIIESRFIDR